MMWIRWRNTRGRVLRTENTFLCIFAYNVHKHFHQSTPMQIGLFKLALLLHKTFNSTNHSKDWLSLANQIVSTGRQHKFDILRTNNHKIGLNIMANKFYYLKLKIELDLLNLSLNSYKSKMKPVFEPYE